MTTIKPVVSAKDPVDRELPSFEPPQDNEPLTKDVRTSFDWYSPALTLAVGLIVLISSIQMGLGTIASPAPGLWPFLCSLALLAFVPLMLFSRARVELPNHRELLKVLGIVAPLGLFVPLYSLAGFIGSATVVLFFIGRVIGKLGWWSSLGLAIITPITVYLVFGELLGVNLRAF